MGYIKKTFLDEPIFRIISLIRAVIMLIKTLSIILIMSRQTATKGLIAKKIHHVEPVTEDSVILRPRDNIRIKSYVQSMNHYKDGPIKDPGSYCRTFDTCYECVKSVWFPCGWCHDFGCTDNPEHHCPFAETEAKRFNITGELKACPYIGHQGSILVPEGLLTKIKVQLYGPDPAILEKEITCQIIVGNRLTNIVGTIQNGYVHCSPIVLQSYANLYRDKNRGALSLVWGGAQPYSNRIPLIVYNCEVAAINCEECTKIPAEYGCGWCAPTAKCVMQGKCALSLFHWIRDSSTCKVYGKEVFVFLCSRLNLKAHAVSY